MTKVRRNRFVGIATAVVVSVALAAGCISSDTEPQLATTAAPAPSTSSPSSTTTTTSTTTAPTTTTIGPRQLSIPVGPGGIEYREGGYDLESVGPDLLAIGPDGVAYLNDPVGNQLWVLGNAEPTAVDLASLDILNASALAVDDEVLTLVEITFAPVRQRVHELSTETFEVIRTTDLPAGARLDDGLSGVLVGDDGQTKVVLEGGTRFATIDPVNGSGSVAESLNLGSHTLAQDGPDFLIDEVKISADLTGPHGGLRILGVSQSGTVVLIREDVITTSPFEVVVTVEWYDAAGTFEGSSRVPANEDGSVAAITVAPDGSVFAVLLTPEEVRIEALDRVPERITTAERQTTSA